jgi:glucose/arabinose dehydrogenase
MRNISGTIVGTASFTETAEGVQVSLEVTGLTDAAPGLHGIHFHQVGRCDPDFAVAREHFNPNEMEHGLQNPDGPHAGDLPTIEFDDNGNATYTATALTTLNGGELGLLDADGSSLLIHANPDDQMTDPSGFSGMRIACGVVTAQGVPTPAAPAPPAAMQGNLNEPERRSPTEDRIAQLQLPDGFEIHVFGQDLGNVRMMAEGEDGTVYVTRRSQGDVIALRDENGDGMAEMPPMIVTSELPYVHGILINDGQMYLATATAIYRGDIGADGGLENLNPLVSDLPQAGQHPNRTMAFGPDGNLYVSIGSPCNACSIDDPEYATILQVSADGTTRTIFAEGLRNTIGFGFHPETGELWGMDHGSDWRGDDQPPEELNLIAQGNNYGWPYCFGDRQVDPYITNSNPFVTKQEFCAMSTGPALTYQAHSAPIGMIFYTGDLFPEEYQNDAFVAMRGSWNRDQAVGYKVVRIDFDEDGQPTTIDDFITGWLIEDGTAQFGRIAGLLQMSDGSLLISDDSNGVIYHVTYTGE